MDIRPLDPRLAASPQVAPDDLQAIAAESLVIWTTKDPSGPVDEGERIASLIPNGQLVVMENCGHWPQYEDPATFNRVQLRFLQDGHAQDRAAGVTS